MAPIPDPRLLHKIQKNMLEKRITACIFVGTGGVWALAKLKWLYFAAVTYPF